MEYSRVIEFAEVSECPDNHKCWNRLSMINLNHNTAHSYRARCMHETLVGIRFEKHGNVVATI